MNLKELEEVEQIDYGTVNDEEVQEEQEVQEEDSEVEVKPKKGKGVSVEDASGSKTGKKAKKNAL